MENTPTHVIKFQYCGGWGYRRHVLEAIDKIDKHFKAKKGQKPYFKYYMQQDLYKTGNLEVTVHPFNSLKGVGSEDGPYVEGEGILVHSKAKTGRYII